MTPNRATGVALLAALAWGLGNVAQKTILEHLDGFAATGITSLVGAAVLWPLAWREGKVARPRAQGGSLHLLLAVSLLFTFASTVMQFGYGLTTVTNAGFLVNTAAVLTPVLAWAVFRQRPPLAIWPASGAAMTGIYLMAGAHWSGLGAGDMLALLSACGFAVWTLTVAIYVVRTRRPVVMTAVQLTVCGVLCTAVGAAVYGPPTPAALAAALPEILFMGIVSKGLAYVLIAIAQQHVSATSVAVLSCAEAVFGAIIAALVLGETLGPMRGLGALCIIAGVILAARIPATRGAGGLGLAALPAAGAPFSGPPARDEFLRAAQPDCTVTLGQGSGVGVDGAVSGRPDGQLPGDPAVHRAGHRLSDPQGALPARALAHQPE